ncbi:hypothetical protein AAY473_016912 [Plecturocebus cupreus]
MHLVSLLHVIVSGKSHGYTQLSRGVSVAQTGAVIQSQLTATSTSLDSEMGFCHVAQAGLKLLAQAIHLPQPPKVLGLQGRSLALSPGWSAVAQSRLTATSVFPVSSNSPASASRVAGTTGTHHHVRLIFCTLVETGFHRVGQDGLDLLTS